MASTTRLSELGSVLQTDVAEWASTTLNIQQLKPPLSPHFETGVLFCRIAHAIENKHDRTAIQWDESARRGSPEATANLNRFNHWASLLGVPQAMLLSAGAFTDKSNPTEAMLVQLLMQVGQLQETCQPPRSVDVGVLLDEGRIPEPTSTEVEQYCKYADRVLLSLKIPAGTRHLGGWQFNVSGVDLTLKVLHRVMLVRTRPGEWKTLRDVLGSHAAGISNRRPNRGDITQPLQREDTSLDALSRARKEAIERAHGRGAPTEPMPLAAAPSAQAFIAQMEAHHTAAVGERRAALHTETIAGLQNHVRVLQRQVSERDELIKASELAIENMKRAKHDDVERIKAIAGRDLQRMQLDASRELQRLQGKLREAEFKLKTAAQQERANRAISTQSLRNEVDRVRNEHDEAHKHKYADIHGQLQSVRQQQDALLANADETHRRQLAAAVLAKSEEKEAEKIELIKRLEQAHRARVAKLLGKIKELSLGVTGVTVAPLPVASHTTKPDVLRTSFVRPNDFSSLESALGQARAERDEAEAQCEEKVATLNKQLCKLRQDLVTAQAAQRKAQRQDDHTALEESSRKMSELEDKLLDRDKTIKSLRSQMAQARADDAAAAMEVKKAQEDKVRRLQKEVSRLEHELTELSLSTVRSDVVPRSELDELRREKATDLAKVTAELVEVKRKSDTELQLLQEQLADVEAKATARDRRRNLDQTRAIEAARTETVNLHKREIAELEREHEEALRVASQKNAKQLADLKQQHKKAKDSVDDLVNQRSRAEADAAEARKDADDRVHEIETQLKRTRALLEAANNKAEEDRNAAEREARDRANSAVAEMEAKEAEQSAAMLALTRKAKADLEKLNRERQEQLDAIINRHKAEIQRLRKNHEDERDRIHQDALAKHSALGSTKAEHAEQLAERDRRNEESLRRQRTELEDTHRAELNRLQSELREAGATIRKHEETIADLRRQILELEAELARRKAEASQALASAEHKLAQEVQRRKDAEDAARQASDTIEDLKKKIAVRQTAEVALQTELADLRNQIGATNRSAQQETNDLKTKLASADLEIAHLKKRLDEALASLKEERDSRVAAEQQARDADVRALAAADKAETDFQAEKKEANLALAKERHNEEVRAKDDAAWQNHQMELKLEAAQKESDKLKYFRQDLCDWINDAVKPSPKLIEDCLLRDLASGAILCRLATALDAEETAIRTSEYLEKKAGWDKAIGEHQAIPGTPPSTPKSRSREGSKKGSGIRGDGPRKSNEYTPPNANEKKSPVRDKIVQRQLQQILWNDDAMRGSQEAARNITTFLTWARTLGLEDPDAFQLNDLLNYENPRRVFFGLYDVARRTRGKIPTFVTLERMRYTPRNRKNVLKDDPVDVFVNDMLCDCVCNPRIEMTRMSDGKYMMSNLDKPLLLLVRGSQVVVRIGGGFRNFRDWLQEKDVCRHSKTVQLKRQQFAEIQGMMKTGALVEASGEPSVALFTNRLVTPSNSPGSKSPSSRKRQELQVMTAS